MKKTTGLGRGINNFIKDSSAVEKLLKQEDNSNLEDLNIEDINPNEEQARKHFDEQAIKELAESIKEHGLIQPIIVRKDGDKYTIIAGERRYRAAKSIGLKTIPAIVKDISEENADKISLIENIQRQDLNPIEEAQGYKRVLDLYDMTQEELSKTIGKSRQYIGNTIRLLKLDERVIEYMEKGLLTTSHGKLLLSIKNKDEQYKQAKKIVESGKTVKQTRASFDNKKKDKKEGNIFMDRAMRDLSDALGTKVVFSDRGKKKNIVIEYYNDDDLQRIYEKIIGSDIDEIL